MGYHSTRSYPILSSSYRGNVHWPCDSARESGTRGKGDGEIEKEPGSWRAAEQERQVDLHIPARTTHTRTFHEPRQGGATEAVDKVVQEKGHDWESYIEAMTRFFLATPAVQARNADQSDNSRRALNMTLVRGHETPVL